MTQQVSSSSKISATATYVVRKLWTLFAIALVVLALTISLLRYSLPLLNDNKAYFEDYIASAYAIDIEIGQLEADWQNDGPTITLKNVFIKNTASSPVRLNVGKVFVEVDFWASIMSRKLRSNEVGLNELNLAVDINRIKRANSDIPIISALENIFLEQLTSFVVSNSRLTLISQENNQTVDITMLSWLNMDNRHQGTGVFTLEDFSENNASFILDLYGNVDSYSGTLFAQAQDVNLSAWINEFTGLQNELISSKGNLEVWGKIENGEFNRIDGKVLPSTFEWTVEDSIVSNSINARFAAEKVQDQWDFSIADLYFSSQDESVLTSLNGYYSAQKGAVFELATPISLKPLVSLNSLYSLSLSDNLEKIAIDASLNSLKVMANKKGLTVQADVENIGWQEHNQIMGIENMRASVFWQGRRGKVIFEATDTLLSAQHYFERILPIRKLSIPVLFDLGSKPNSHKMQTTNQNEHADLSSGEPTSVASISVNEGVVDVDDWQFHINSQYGLQNKFLSLAVNIDPFALKKVPQLLPKHLLGEGTRRFLQNAFTGKGRVNSANALWHGKLDSFPFDDNTGIFQTQVAIENADFTFSKTWPQLTQLDIDVKIENKALTIEGPSGMLEKVALSNIKATVPNLKANAMLTIIADGAASSKDITALMLQSSLANSLGKLLNRDVLVDGDLTTQLALYVPLKNGAKTRAKGEVYLRNNTVSIPAINVALNNTNGRVNFDNETITIKNVKASLLGQAVTFDVDGKKLSDKYSLSANMAGNWEAKPLAQYINADFAGFFNGSADWDFTLGLDLMPNDFTYNAQLNSSLVGIETNLPQPLAKTKLESLPLVLNAQGTRIASSVNINLADVAKFDGALAHKEKQFNRAHLALGNKALEARGLGFSISGVFEELIAQNWYPLIRSLSGSPNPAKKNLLGVPERIFVNTKKLSIAGQSFLDADITIKREQDKWAFNIDADDLKSNISLFDDRVGKGLLVDAQYIRIAKTQDDEKIDEQKEITTKNTIDPKMLPNIEFNCQDCDILGIKLGAVKLAAEPNNDGLKISQFTVNTEHGNVSASGQWYKRNQDHYTFIAGDISSNDFGAFVNQLGFNAGIKDSSAQSSFALTWKDSPVDIAFENLDGQIDWALSDGSLTEVSDQGSRIFTLLSLNSLVRKLSLDFRDVFAKGFFYDDMKGSVQIAQGIADTRDTFIDGAAGEIEIYGNTNLATRELNYNVSFAPNVTGNLPVLVYFFTVSPPTALAALAIDQVLTSAKVISNINYSVTGTIAQPILVETGRQSTEVELPARVEDISSDDLPPFIPPGKENKNIPQDASGIPH